jgi:protein subunit release factor B
MLEIEYQELFNKFKKIKEKRFLDRYIKPLIIYEAITSSKPGGQYAQHRHTKVKAKFETKNIEKILKNYFDIDLHTNQKLILNSFEKYIIAISEDERTQFENKKIATERLINKIYDLLDKIFPKIKGFQMQEPFEAEEKRIKEKKIRSNIKKLRKRIK